MSEFVGGYQHNVDQENMTAIVTAAIVAGRALFPIGRYLVWHMWDKAKGIWSKVDDMDQIEITEEMATALRQQQQQTTTAATPSNSKVKMNSEGEMNIYSESPKITLISSTSSTRSPARQTMRPRPLRANLDRQRVLLLLLRNKSSKIWHRRNATA